MLMTIFFFFNWYHLSFWVMLIVHHGFGYFFCRLVVRRRRTSMRMRKRKGRKRKKTRRMKRKNVRRRNIRMKSFLKGKDSQHARFAFSYSAKWVFTINMHLAGFPFELFMLLINCWYWYCNAYMGDYFFFFPPI